MRHVQTLIVALGMTLCSITSALAEDGPDGQWERSLSLGFNQARGNADTLLFRNTWRAEQIRERDEWSMVLDWTFGESDNEKNNEFGQFAIDRKRLVTSRRYFEGLFDIHYDAIARLDYRIITGPAYGVFLVRRPERRFSVEAGPSYVREKERRSTDHYIAARLAQEFEQRINERAKVWQSAEYIPRLDDLDQFLLNGEIGVEAAVNDQISLEVVLQNRYDSRPAEDTKKNDVYLTAAAKMTF